MTVAHGVGVYSLNPYAVNTSPLQAVWGSVMEPLIDADYDKRGYQGVLAESWQMKGAKLQFKLRKGVRFHDGTPFSSKDVVASFKRILTDKQSLQAPNLENIKEMDAPDDLTVVLTLKKADANALEDINSRVIMKQSAAEKMGEADNPPIGTGPFKFVSWDRSGQFVIRRNENYWGQPPKIDEVIYKEYPRRRRADCSAGSRARRISSATFRPMKWSDLNPIRGCACSRCRDCGRFFSF